MLLRAKTRFLAALAAMSAPAALATPIYLKAGQCVIVGTQEVCAMTADSTAATSTQPNIIHSCRYDHHANAEVSNLKSWALFQVVVRPDGGKTETQIKNFGINDKDKDACNQEADRLNASHKP